MLIEKGYAPIYFQIPASRMLQSRFTET